MQIPIPKQKRSWAEIITAIILALGIVFNPMAADSSIEGEVADNTSDIAGIQGDYVTENSLDKTLDGYVLTGDLPDLSGYVTTGALDKRLADFATSDDLSEATKNFLTSGAITAELSKYVTQQEADAMWYQLCRVCDELGLLFYGYPYYICPAYYP